MFLERNISHVYCREVIGTTMYTLKKIKIKEGTSKTPYELWFDHTPFVKYFRIFGSKNYIKRDDEIGNFDARSDEGIFLGYSTKRNAYKCFNLRLRKIIESNNVKIDERFQIQERTYDCDQNIQIKEATPTEEELVEAKYKNETFDDDKNEATKIPKTLRYINNNHPKNQNIGNTNQCVMTRSKARG